MVRGVARFECNALCGARNSPPAAASHQRRPADRRRWPKGRNASSELCCCCCCCCVLVRRTVRTACARDAAGRRRCVRKPAPGCHCAGSGLCAPTAASGQFSRLDAAAPHAFGFGGGGGGGQKNQLVSQEKKLLILPDSDKTEQNFICP